MDSLYGDLPPAADETPVSNVGWSKSSAVSNPAEVHVKGAPAAVASSKPKTFLAFKPAALGRQPAGAKSASQSISTVAAPTVKTGIAAAPVVVTESVIPKVLQSEIPTAHEILRPKAFDGDTNVASFDVANPYDPAFPNDYLSWCEERLERRRLDKLQEENNRKLVELEKARLEKERTRAEALHKGDYNKVQETMGAGRGRGRGGLTNLPAWMMKQAPSVGGVNDDSSSSSRSAMEVEAEAVSVSDGLLPFSSSKDRYDDVHDHEDNESVGEGDYYGTRREEGRADNTQSRYGGTQIRRNDDTYGSNPAERMMSRMGHVSGEGLGKDGRGITQPLEHRGFAGHGRVAMHPTDQQRLASDSGVQSGSTFSTLGASSYKRKLPGVFSSPSTVLLLKNMVAAGDVDESLAAETKAECGKFGNVKECRVYEVSRDNRADCPPEECVRTFVMFDSQESSVRAYRDMNGRFFAGRQITACFYDEGKYMSGDLAPAQDEW